MHVDDAFKIIPGECVEVNSINFDFMLVLITVVYCSNDCNSTYGILVETMVTMVNFH